MENSRWLEKQISIIKYSCYSNGFALAATTLAIGLYWSIESFPQKYLWINIGLTVAAIIIIAPSVFLRLNLSNKQKLKLSQFLYDPLLYFCPLFFSYITLFHYKNGDAFEMALFSIIVAGNCVGSALTLLHNRTLSYFQIVFYMVPYAWASFTLGTKFGYTMTGAGSLFLVVLLAQIYLIHRMFRNEFSLTEKNFDLLEENKRNTEAMIENSKMVSLGRMAGGVSHEINNPLAILGSLVNRLQSKAEAGSIESSEVNKLADRMNNSIERIVGIIKGLRRISRDEKATDLKDYEVDVLIDETLAMCQEKFRAHGVELTRPEPSGLYLFCQPVQISQVMLNLLNNSFDAVLESEKKHIEVQVKEANNRIIISVIDSGPGIAGHHVSNIMEPFFTTKELGKGTGLGLSISHTIMSQHNGSLALDEKSKKTKFDMVFPNASTRSKSVA